MHIPGFGGYFCFHEIRVTVIDKRWKCKKFVSHKFKKFRKFVSMKMYEIFKKCFHRNLKLKLSIFVVPIVVFMCVIFFMTDFIPHTTITKVLIALGMSVVVYLGVAWVLIFLAIRRYLKQKEYIQ